MFKFRRILVPIKDLNPKPHAAAVKAAQLASLTGGQVELFHAYDHLVDVYAVPDALEPESFAAADHPKILQKLEVIAKRLRRFGARVTTAVETDYPPHEAIVRRARRMRADLVVIDTRGHHRTPSVLKVTDWEVLRHSPVPVLLVKSSRHYRHPAIIAAVDPRHSFAKPSGLDKVILDAGGTLEKLLGGKLHAMHAFVPIPATAYSAEMVTPDLAADLFKVAERDAKRGMGKLLRYSRIPASRRHLVPVHPSDAIPRTVRSTHAGIVVMGAVSRSGLKRIFIGNTAERVMDQVECDVLVVKPKRFDPKVPARERGVHWQMFGGSVPL